MSISVAASNVFIDLATFAEVEGFLYGGPEAVTLFVRVVQKSNWFSYLPISLRHQGLVDFGQKNASASVNRSGDYVLGTWFRAQIPQIGLFQDGNIFLDATIRWTRNLMHNLFEKISISFNELVVQEFDDCHLDFNFQHRVPAHKRMGYRNMIGDIAAMTTPVGPGAVAGQFGPPLGTGGFFQVPFPFWFSEDHGVALPIAALPFNDVKLNYTFRRFEDLIVVYPGLLTGGGPAGPGTGRAATINDVFVFGQQGTRPQLLEASTFAHYAVVHNDERVAMGDAPRDILIHQIQVVQQTPFKDVSSRSSFDLRLSHAIRHFDYAARNVSLQGDRSNYTTEPNGTGSAPLAFTTLVYENTPRFAMGTDYTSLMKPYWASEAIPDETGYHRYSYSLRANSLEPMGSTNFSKLANVALLHDFSPAGIAAADTNNPVDGDGQPLVYPDSSGVLQNFPQRFEHCFRANNWNIARVANGSFGHPTL